MAYIAMYHHAPQRSPGAPTNPSHNLECDLLDLRHHELAWILPQSEHILNEAPRTVLTIRCRITHQEALCGCGQLEASAEDF